MHVDYSEPHLTSIYKFGTTRHTRGQERHRRERGRRNPIPIKGSVVLLVIRHTENAGSPKELHVAPADLLSCNHQASGLGTHKLFNNPSHQCISQIGSRMR